MEKICLEILNRWAEFVNYDEKQTQFNLLDWSHDVHCVTKNLKHIIEDYDETGLLAVLSVKKLFYKMLTNTKLSLFDVFSLSDEIDECQNMLNLLNSEDVVQAENNYLDKIQKLVSKVFGKGLIGEIDTDEFGFKVLDYTNTVVSELDKCKIEFYKKGSDLSEITNFSTNINIFPSLAQCVLSLQNASDGMYLCFIDINHTADSYFGFFIKNSGNLFSVHERVDEAFKGQHCNSRNGRWTEGKVDDLFPYDFIFKYDDFDYKGYSHTYKIDENKLSFSEMGEDAFLPLLLAMILITNKLKNEDLSKYEPVFIDSLLKVNLPLTSEDKNELMILDKNELVQYTNSLDLKFDYQSIMDGSALNEFQPLNKNDKKDCLVYSQNRGQIFVDLYGEGFELPTNLLSSQKLLSLDDYSYIPEFVGSEYKMRGQAYCEIRKQLADYIYQKMYEEYKSFGGIKAVQIWFENQVKLHLDQLRKLAVEHYIGVKNGSKQNVTGNWSPSVCDEHYYISMLEDVKYVSFVEYGSYYLINEQDKRTLKSFDLENGLSCSIFFVFRLIDYIGLENLFGDVPKIVKGWSNRGNNRYGNSLLNMTDEVEEINTPFEYYCSRRPEYKDDRTYTNFAFVIGFSKRGFKSLYRKYDLG